MPTLSFDVTADNAARIRAAIGKAIDLRDEQNQSRIATAEEVRQYIIRHLQKMVRYQEEKELVQRQTNAVTDVPIA